MYQEVYATKLQERTIPWIRTDIYAFNPNKKHHWLQKACLWILDKLQAHYVDTKVEFTRIRIDPQKFMEKVFQQKAEIARSFNKNGATLLVGSGDYAQMMGEMDHHTMLNFRAEYRHVGTDVNGDYVGKYCGLNVRVIPWMQGILVLP